MMAAHRPSSTTARRVAFHPPRPSSPLDRDDLLELGEDAPLVFGLARACHCAWEENLLDE